VSSPTPAPNPANDQRHFEDALRVARMYYHLDLTTTEIADRLGMGRPTISRLLGWARRNGLVEFRVIDTQEQQLELEQALETRYQVADVKVVPAHPDTTVLERQALVTSFAAHHLNALLRPGMTVAIAWGATISMLAERLIPKPLPDAEVVQLTGSGNLGQGITYAAGIITAFANNYGARAHLLPVPAYFDDPSTKEAMFRERAIRRVRDLADHADVTVFSIGVPDADSYIYRAGYLEEEDLRALQARGAVGDIATVFFRSDGSYRDLAMNERSSGPDLAQLGRRGHAICLVVGEKKALAAEAALRGRFIHTLIIDEPTARLLR
jgi:DNA-binding transcriptional regulator LsrR (DeoR family)